MSLPFGSSGAACSRSRKSNFRPQCRLCCKSQMEVEELATATSAAYGILLLGGDLLAFTRSGSKASLFGGLTGAALMVAVDSSHQIFATLGFCLVIFEHEILLRSLDATGFWLIFLYNHLTQKLLVMPLGLGLPSFFLL